MDTLLTNSFSEAIVLVISSPTALLMCESATLTLMLVLWERIYSLNISSSVYMCLLTGFGAFKAFWAYGEALADLLGLAGDLGQGSVVYTCTVLTSTGCAEWWEKRDIRGLDLCSLISSGAIDEVSGVPPAKLTSSCIDKLLRCSGGRQSSSFASRLSRSILRYSKKEILPASLPETACRSSGERYSYTCGSLYWSNSSRVWMPSILL